MKIYNINGDLIFDGTDLSKANLSRANLEGTNLLGTNLNKVQIDEKQMPVLLEAIGVQVKKGGGDKLKDKDKKSIFKDAKDPQDNNII